MPKRVYDQTPLHRIKPDWDLILNGEAWEIERGIDFSCTIRTFRVNLHNQCKRKDLSYKSHIKAGDENVLYVQVFPLSIEQCTCGKDSLFNEKTKQYIGCCFDCMPF